MRGYDENDRAAAWLDDVCAHVRWKPVRGDIRLELADHIRSQAGQYIADGETEEAAYARAVADMGDAGETGAMLDKLHRPAGQLPLLIAAALLGVLAILLHDMASQGDTSGFSFAHSAFRTGVSVAGLALMAALYFADYRHILRAAAPAVLLWCAGMAFVSIVYIGGGYANVRLVAGEVIAEALYTCAPLAMALALGAPRMGDRGRLLLCAAVPSACLLGGIAFYNWFGQLYIVTQGCFAMALFTGGILLTAMCKGVFGRKDPGIYAALGVTALAIAILAVGIIAMYVHQVQYSLPQDDTGREVLAAAQFIGPCDMATYMAANGKSMFDKYTFTYVLANVGWLPVLALAALLTGFAVRALRGINKLTGGTRRWIAGTLLGSLVLRVVLYAFGEMSGLGCNMLGMPLLGYGTLKMLADGATVGFMLALLRGRELPCIRPQQNMRRLKD